MKTLTAIIFAVFLAACGQTTTITQREAEVRAAEQHSDAALPGLGNWTEEYGFGGP